MGFGFGDLFSCLISSVSKIGVEKVLQKLPKQYTWFDSVKTTEDAFPHEMVVTFSFCSAEMICGSSNKICFPHP